MCRDCDPDALLARAGLETTPNRRTVLAAILLSPRALTPREILHRVRKSSPLNKVTLYRILDLLVEHGLVGRHSALDRSFRYCPAVIPGHPRHYHFLCRRCGQMTCLDPASVRIELSGLDGTVETAEVRLDGICGECLRSAPPE